MKVRLSTIMAPWGEAMIVERTTSSSGRPMSPEPHLSRSERVTFEAICPLDR